MSTTLTPRQTSRWPESHTTSHRFTSHRSAFARGIVFQEFRSRDARAIDHGAFQDRRPDTAPQRLDQIAAQVVCTTGQAALNHWLREAARTTGQEREAALEIARAVAEMVGLDWAEIMPEQAA